jgi:hypothetical protein
VLRTDLEKIDTILQETRKVAAEEKRKRNASQESTLKVSASGQALSVVTISSVNISRMPLVYTRGRDGWWDGEQIEYISGIGKGIESN